MTPSQIKQKVLKYNWEFWADRPFGAFILSLFKDGQTRPYMRRFGVDAEWLAILFQNSAWYKSEEIWDKFAIQLKRYLAKGGSVFKVVGLCEEFYKQEKKNIVKLVEIEKNPIKKLGDLYEILTQVVSFVWFAHGFEHLYLKKMRKEIPKYYSGDIERIIGDLSYPIKKNAHVYFERALRSSMPLSKVQQKSAWIKVRDGFSSGFTISELAAERKKLKKQKITSHFKRPIIHPALKNLIRIAQELVYFRTLRSDILFEFLYLARPILKQVARYYHIPFNQLKHYSVQDLISGKQRRYSHTICAISWGKNFALLNHPVLQEKYENIRKLKGIIAYPGKVSGITKIVKVAHEIGKVKDKDILVAPTTAPSFIIGMKRASAFVTDEGGITSHAAIVAREMRKPCIIGTKIATKVLKDGDFVEVDAEQGVVKIIKKR